MLSLYAQVPGVQVDITIYCSFYYTKHKAQKLFLFKDAMVLYSILDSPICTML